jgi:CheY-like chemotaxis protein
MNMRKKINCILLIDDDKSTNFLHKIIIEETGVSEKVEAVQTGQEALDYLERKKEGVYPRPDLIFLDINMPGMNGWEFLEEYEKLDDNIKGEIMIMMLTTSINPDDEEKAKNTKFINGFLNKPLTTEALEKIIDDHFQNKE